MDMVLLIIVLLIVAWWLGFLNSFRRMANIANRAGTSLELQQGEKLMEKWGRDGKTVDETREFLSKFDAL